MPKKHHQPITEQIQQEIRLNPTVSTILVKLVQIPQQPPKAK